MKNKPKQHTKMNSYWIIIRETQPNDASAVSEVVRGAYASNVSRSWFAALFNEWNNFKIEVEAATLLCCILHDMTAKDYNGVMMQDASDFKEFLHPFVQLNPVTFQAIVLLAAFLFIFVGVPPLYCLVSVPIVLLMLYILIYGSMLMKAAEIMHTKRPLQSWVAEAYEPYFFTEKPQNCVYRLLAEDRLREEGGAELDLTKFRKTIIGTCAVMPHNLSKDWAWLYRLAVDVRYRNKGVGLMLTKTAQQWCKNNHFNFVELVITECQEDARQLFANAGFQVKQMYHKKVFTSIFSIAMFQLRCEVRSTYS